MTKHTEGPWYIHKDYYDNKSGENSAIMYKSGDNQFKTLARVIQNPADALLIASAPELLEALISLADCAGITALPGYKPELDAAMIKARAAIAKAEGNL